MKHFFLILCIILPFNGCYVLKHHKTLKPSSNDLDVVKQLAKKYQYVGMLTAELPQQLNPKQEKYLMKLIRSNPYAEYVLNSNISIYVDAFTNKKKYSREASEIMKNYIEGKYKGHKVHVYLLRNYEAAIFMSSYLFLFEYNNEINLIVYEDVLRRRYYYVIKSGLYIQPWVSDNRSRAIDQNIGSELERLLKR